ncbi:hypothetical protein PP187_gp167 [Klebsiella phage vB_KvM-Eowyn]|uniref:Uncharacterized protein n=1 Tax=Klebsiella phage vB_KvM-Eowyn TaxID=2762819 RepID=A0A7R8MJM6_9CAUD|nr:hypothetical protein PP187_gp167 [Klebsiella phage vB_KvM-Eowyn]CAD5236156.1 hypothetical protein LLCLJKAH_00167 [Klebsiella phage vB_KvM-Eowyn]
MFSTFFKILPALWPFFVEIITGGKKDDFYDTPSKLKSLFIIFAVLVALLGYGSYQLYSAWVEIQESRQTINQLQSKLGALTPQLDEKSSQIVELKRELAESKSEAQGLRYDKDEWRSKYEEEHHDAQLHEFESTQLRLLLNQCLVLTPTLQKFKETKHTPEKLREHNRAIDKLNGIKHQALSE